MSTSLSTPSHAAARTVVPPAAEEGQLGSTDFRVARPRHYLMCAPEYFAVEYAINAWMDPQNPVDRGRAQRQWNALVETYRGLGHRVDTVRPQPGLPDMVFAANSGTVVDGVVLGARFRSEARAAEAEHFRRWFLEHGWRDVTMPSAVNEAEGDFTWTGSVLLAGHGFRTDPAAHAEAQETLGVPVVSLRLVDERFYHLDTALFVLDDKACGPTGQPLVAYYPPAFSPGSQQVLRRLFPDAVLADATDAEAFGLNGISDGRHVLLPPEATQLARQVTDRGFEVVEVDLSEFKKSGGGIKCCTMELRG